MQPIQLTPFQALWRSILMVIQAAPIELRHLVLLNLVGGAGPAAVLFLNKIAIDEVSHLFGTHETTNIIALVLSQPRLLWSIVGLIILNLLVDSIGTVSVFAMSSLRDRTQGYVQAQVLSKVANFDDITLFETPELLNIVQLSENALQRLKQLAVIVGSTLTGLFAFVPSVSFSATIAWWVPLLMIVSAAPSIYVQMRYQKYSWRVERTQASTVREMNLYAKVLTGEEYAKELRLF
ncbi:MAG: hypothetical protein JO235_25825, partial [Chroococcidiopsidaceae cyanobacterium CP_BM_RX_35]|nr:hypothetical protein [Chroococcidiopsidaceae cyanobacterium CP_BM_RX_35]